jgi:flagellar motor switch protein FliN/FliY
MTALEEIGHLSDVAVDVDVELDRKTMTVRQILELDVGSVIKMMRSAGENIDILVGGAVIGTKTCSGLDSADPLASGRIDTRRPHRACIASRACFLMISREQAPPTKPSIWPSANTIARSPR